MSLTLCVLASSSSGNCIFVRSAQTAILIDAGLSAREIARRLAEAGGDVAAVRAVCLSHEHADHTAGIAVLQRKHGLALYANAGTIEGVRQDPKCGDLAWQVFTTGSPFRIGDLTIEPFSVPHDAFDPVGFVLESGGVRVGVATDMGMATTLIRERLRPCHALVLEANHDEYLVQQSPRPWALKQRILGRQGHLSNRAAAAMLAEIAGPALRRVYLAHLSSECNEPGLALRAVRESLDKAGHVHVALSMTYPDRVSESWSA